jgi:uncharacterized membrane protein YbhN (UPF0104 family)
MHVLRSGRRLALAFASLAVVWTADLAMVLLVMIAVGISPSIGAGLLVLFTVNVTIAVPTTPASVGTLELGVLAATNLLGIPDATAFAFAVLYHTLQVVPLVIVGIMLEMPLVLGREPMEARA